MGSAIGLLNESEFYRFLKHAPENMQVYIEVDVEQIAQDWFLMWGQRPRPLPRQAGSCRHATGSGFGPDKVRRSANRTGGTGKRERTRSETGTPAATASTYP